MNRISIESTTDGELVWSLVHDESVFSKICDDNWSQKTPQELKSIVIGLCDNVQNHMVVVKMDGRPAGCFLACATGDGQFEVHTCLGRDCRGRDAIAAGKMAMQHVLAMPDVKRLYSFCPVSIPEAYLFARYCGWHKAGISAVKWIKHGISYSIRVVEATKADLKMEGVCH